MSTKKGYTIQMQAKTQTFIKACLLFVSALQRVNRIGFVIAFVLLMAGAALNDKHNADIRRFGDFCYVVRTGVFAGAMLAFAAVIFTIIYYIIESATKKLSGVPQNQNIVMAQPQHGQSNVLNLFVPEN